MDPKASSTLDPQLQQAYDRVMGVATSTPPDPAVGPAQPPVTPPSQPGPSIPMPALTVQPTEPTPVAPVTPPMATVESTVTTKTHSFVAKSEGKGKISPVIWALGGVVFLAIYTIIWIKVFNLPVPFINQ